MPKATKADAIETKIDVAPIALLRSETARLAADAKRLATAILELQPKAAHHRLDDGQREAWANFHGLHRYGTLLADFASAVSQEMQRDHAARP